MVQKFPFPGWWLLALKSFKGSSVVSENLSFKGLFTQDCFMNKMDSERNSLVVWVAILTT